MGLDKKRFMNARFEPRTAEVPVPALKEYFGEDEENPSWTVRGLEGRELGQAHEAAERNRQISAILEGLLSEDNREKVASIRKMLGLGDETPRDIAKRVEMLTLGSVEPECDLELALKLCRAFPIEFYELTNKIVELTGRGHIPGKAKPSGATPTSEPA